METFHGVLFLGFSRLCRVGSGVLWGFLNGHMHQSVNTSPSAGGEK